MIEKQVKRNVIYEGKILEVVCDDIVLEDGKEAKRELVLHNGAIVVALQDDDGKFFMVKQYRYAHGKDMLEYCAGKLEKGEDKEAAAYRECQEELGYEVEDLRYLGQLIPTCAYATEVIHMYYGKKGKYVGQHFDEDERLDLFKYSLSEIKEMILDGRIDDSKTIALTYKIEMAKIDE